MLINIFAGSIGFFLVLFTMLFVNKVHWNRETMLATLSGVFATFAGMILFFGGIATL